MTSRLVLPPFRRDDEVEVPAGLAVINEKAAGFFVIDDDLQEYSNKVPSTSDVMTRGSTTSVDSNDPSVFTTDVACVRLPGTTLNTLSVAHSAPMDITGDIDVRAHVAPDVWGSGTQNLVAARTSVAAWNLRLNSSGALTFLWYDATNSVTVETSTVATSFTDGEDGYVRVTLDVDNGSGGHDVTFYTSTDGSSWTQLGTVKTNSGTTDIKSYTNSIAIGSRTTAATNMLTGRVFGAQILDGIDGTVVMDVDIATDNPTFDQDTFTATSGQAVTISRSTTSLQAVVLKPDKYLSQLDGTDDYFILPTACTPTLTPSTGEHTVLVAYRDHTAAGSSEIVISSESAIDNGLILFRRSTEDRLVASMRATGPNADTGHGNNTYTEGSVVVAGAVCDDGALAVYDDTNGVSSTVSYTSLSSLVFAPTRVGFRSNNTIAMQIEVFSVVVFQEALTLSELDDVSSYLKSLT